MIAATPPDPQASGVYRTPPDVTALSERAGARAPAWIEADLIAVRTKRALLETLARAARFPPHFGMNWDALADALQDLPDTNTNTNAVFLHLAHPAGARTALAQEWSTLLEILEDAAIYSKGRQRLFVVFIDDAPELPAWR